MIVTVETTASKVEAEAVKAAVTNGGTGVRGWAMTELAWGVGTFLRVALSILASRIIWGLVFNNDRRKRIYDNAGALLVNGKTEKPYERPSGWERYRAGGATSSPGASPFDFAGHDARSSNSEGAKVPQGAVFKGTYGGVPIYHHGPEILAPGRQLWPCPVLYRHPCETCSFFVASRSGRGMCATVEKLKMILDGKDDGQDPYEIVKFMKDAYA